MTEIYLDTATMNLKGEKKYDLLANKICSMNNGKTRIIHYVIT